MNTFRRLLIVPTLACAALLGGCFQTPGGGGAVPSDVIKQVTDATKQICSFVPTATTIINLFDANGSFASTAAIANQICSAVNTMSARRGGKVKAPVVIVNNKTVKIEGSRVAKSKAKR